MRFTSITGLRRWSTGGASMNKGSFFMGGVMLAIFTTMVGIAIIHYPAQARFMPLDVGIPGIVLCLLQLGFEWRRRPVAGPVDTRRNVERTADETVQRAGRDVDLAI